MSTFNNQTGETEYYNKEGYSFSVTSGTPGSMDTSYHVEQSDAIEYDESCRAETFTLIVDGVTVCDREPISRIGSIDKTIGNYRYVF